MTLVQYGTVVTYLPLSSQTTYSQLLSPQILISVFSSGGSEQYAPTEEERKVHEQLVNSAWCGLLAALTVLLEACTDEAATESILKAIQVCVCAS